jgi:uncharacterized protein (TIGR00251 family)
MLTPMPDGVILSVRIIPRARKTEISGTRGGALLVRVNAPPVEGAANAALVELLASRLKIPRHAIQIRGGEHARVKRVAIAGVTADAVRAALLSG